MGMWLRTDVPESTLWFFHDREESLYFYMAALIVPFGILYVFDYFSLSWGITSTTITWLQSSLLRRYLNYNSAAQTITDPAVISVAFHQDSRALAKDGYRGVIRLFSAFGNLAVLVIFQITAPYAFSKPFRPSAISIVLLLPLVLFLFLYCRSGATKKVLEEESRAEAKTVGATEVFRNCCSSLSFNLRDNHLAGNVDTLRLEFKKVKNIRLVSDFNKRGAVVDQFEQHVKAFRTATRHVGQLTFNNRSFCKWLSELLITFWFGFAGLEVISGNLSLGLFLPSIFASPSAALRRRRLAWAGGTATTKSLQSLLEMTEVIKSIRLEALEMIKQQLSQPSKLKEIAETVMAAVGSTPFHMRMDGMLLEQVEVQKPGFMLPASERHIVETARDLLAKIPAGGGISQRFMVLSTIIREHLEQFAEVHEDNGVITCNALLFSCVMNGAARGYRLPVVMAVEDRNKLACLSRRAGFLYVLTYRAADVAQRKFEGTPQWILQGECFKDDFDGTSGPPGESTCGRKDGNVHGACTSVDPVGRFERAALDCHIGQSRWSLSSSSSSRRFPPAMTAVDDGRGGTMFAPTAPLRPAMPAFQLGSADLAATAVPAVTAVPLVAATLTQSEKNNYKEKSRSEFMAQRDAMKSHGLPTWRMQNATAVSAVPAIHATCGRAGPGAPQIWEDHGGEGSYGTVLKGLMPYGRFCALKIFKGSKAMISLKQKVLIQTGALTGRALQNAQETSCMKLADLGMSEMMGIEAASIRWVFKCSSCSGGYKLMHGRRGWAEGKMAHARSNDAVFNDEVLSSGSHGFATDHVCNTINPAEADGELVLWRCARSEERVRLICKLLEMPKVKDKSDKHCKGCGWQGAFGPAPFCTRVVLEEYRLLLELKPSSVTQFETKVVRRGVAQDSSSFLSRRPRTCIVSGITPDGLEVADKIYRVTKRGADEVSIHVAHETLHQEHVFDGHIELQSEMSGVLSGTDAASAWRYNAATTVERTSSI
ncbi:unnamed protein product [Cladocopium goreaui]|uniref:Dehydrogenase/reductase SDR family member 1 n=1 Tax=Cladocopium goreaui TaxID=2562237 RepID=A0A9P1FPK5_9DINO|nr:unnamed protein product [Cladocopium goreaui]